MERAVRRPAAAFLWESRGHTPAKCAKMDVCVVRVKQSHITRYVEKGIDLIGQLERFVLHFRLFRYAKNIIPLA